MNHTSLILSVILLVLCITLAKHFYISDDYMLFNWVALPCFIVIFFNLGTLKMKTLQESRLLRYLSGISFTFFLCQVLPLWTISNFLCNIIGNDNNLTKIIISLSVCFIGAIIIHEIIEKPSSKYLKRKLLK